MIEKLVFTSPAKAHSQLNYVAELPAIKALNSEITFKPGLNIIVGPNGSGKTSLLKVIAHHLAAAQLGESAISKQWLQAIHWTQDEQGNESPASPCVINHDGQPILYGDPRRTTGVSTAGIDQENYGQGLMEIMAMKEESSGEQCNRRISPFLQVLQGHANFPPGILNLIGDLSSLGERSQARLAQVDRDWLTATIPRGQQTILLDEPEAGLGLMNQILLWGRILRDPAICERYQIILVSHSNQCLDFEHAHYVELRPGYLDACRQLAAGKLSFDEAARFASNMPQQLSTRELKLLREIRKQQGEFHKGKCVKTADRLEDLSLIHAYRSRRRIAERPKGREIWTATLPTNDTHCYEITSKGMQLLDMHQKDSL